MTQLEQKMHYHFTNASLLTWALTHSSAVSENLGRKSNETLEFLGDSVVQLVISEYLFEHFPDLDEGELSKKRSAIVCAASLAAAAKQIDLGDFLVFGRGEQVSGGRDKANILADAFEALCAAVYLDAGYAQAKTMILSMLQSLIRQAMCGGLVYDYKSALQEALQKHDQPSPQYVLEKITGPEHDATFHVALFLQGSCVCRAQGHNKKSAQQHAAKKALEKLFADVEVEHVSEKN